MKYFREAAVSPIYLLSLLGLFNPWKSKAVELKNSGFFNNSFTCIKYMGASLEENLSANGLLTCLSLSSFFFPIGENHWSKVVTTAAQR